VLSGSSGRARRGRAKIAMVGGGSVNWSPGLIRDFLLKDGLGDAEFRLLDIDLGAAELMARVGRRLASDWGLGATFVPTRSPARALSGADSVVITISTGGLGAMHHDVHLPERYGIFQTVGDTVGPGGWSRALRNVPVFAKLAGQIRKYCPRAAVLNYTNPMGLLTRVLAEHLDQPVVGLCHGVFETIRALMRVFKLKSEEELKLRFGGLNHFFWILEMRVRGRDGYAMLRARLRKQKFTRLFPERPLAGELLREFGRFPYLGDRHTCEFFSRYLAPNRARVKESGVVRTSVHERKRKMARRRRWVRDLAAGRAGIEKQASRETAADIAAAIAGGREFVDIVNVPNVGQVEGLPRGTVVETLGLVNSLGFTPLSAGELPEKILAVTLPHAVNQRLVMEAALSGDRERAFDALALDPLSSHLSLKRVREMGEKLMRATRKHLPQFFGRGRR
jgi:alpha-galactosidase